MHRVPLPWIGFLALLMLSGCFAWPLRREVGGAQTPEEAAEQALADGAGPRANRMGWFDPDHAVLVYNQLGLRDQVEMGYVLVTREQGGWVSYEAGGMGSAGTQEPFLLNAVASSSFPQGAFAFGLLLDPQIWRVEAVLSSGESRLDDPQQGIFLFTFPLEEPPCRLHFLGDEDVHIAEVDLLDPGAETGLPEQVVEAVRARCVRP